MILINVCFDKKNGLNNGRTFFGSYELDDIILTQAIKTTCLKVDCIEAHTHKCYSTGQLLDHYTMYPKGEMVCGCCKGKKELSKSRPAFAVYDRKKPMLNEMIVYGSLVCWECRNNIGAHVDGRLVNIRPLFIEGSSLNSLRKEASNTMITARFVARRWRKKTNERVRVKKALATLTYPIMRWGCKPDGPIYRLAMKRLNAERTV